KAFVVAKKIGIEEKIIPAVFDYNFAQRNMLTSEDDIRNVFILNGVSGEEFD
ncbi:MAG TPA: disulfide isomerase, partial [Idiomarina sp.]|nr:disulfide isomerase [Idiomarina sp.]